MNTLLSTGPGRLLSLAITLALAGGGASLLVTGPAAIPLLGISLLGAVCLSIVALATSIDEKPEFTMLAVITLPVALFLYMVGLGVAAYQAPWAAYAFIGAGAVFGVWSFAGRVLRASSGSPGQVAVAHAE